MYGRALNSADPGEQIRFVVIARGTSVAVVAVLDEREQVTSCDQRVQLGDLLTGQDAVRASYARATTGRDSSRRDDASTASDVRTLLLVERFVPIAPPPLTL